jgi:hypothetical protein
LKDEIIYLYDTKGNLILQQKIISSTLNHQANLSWLPSGIYFYRCGDDVGKLVKN